MDCVLIEPNDYIENSPTLDRDIIDFLCRRRHARHQIVIGQEFVQT